MMTRRRSLRLFGRAAALALLPPVLLTLGCQPIAPQPFLLGDVVSPPQGCSALRRDDPAGDC